MIRMEVEFEPFKKVSFQSYLEFGSAQEFANMIAFLTPPGIPMQTRLFWANGVVFRFFAHQPSETLAKEILIGHLIWDHVEFAPMPSYTNEIKVAEKPLVTICVQDVTRHAVFEPVAKWINENLIRKKTRK
jgi:hypothetical protein